MQENVRLIDANALKEFINNGRVCDICPDKKLNCAIHCDFPDTLTPLWEKVIDNAPTVDTTCPNCDSGYAQGYSDGYLKGKEERPQGEWIKHIRCIECSVCKDKFFADDENENCQDYEPCTDLRFNYCPNCGAKMTKESKE